MVGQRKRDGKSQKLAQQNQEVVESLDCPRPEETRHMKDEKMKKTRYKMFYKTSVLKIT